MYVCMYVCIMYVLCMHFHNIYILGFNSTGWEIKYPGWTKTSTAARQFDIELSRARGRKP
jgi:hypothetical protein